MQLLIEDKHEYSIRQIALKRRINYKSAYNALQQLEEEGAVRIDKKGNISLCSFSEKFTPSTAIVERYRTEQIISKKKFRAIHNALASINSLFVAVLFGSQVKGTTSKHSDIDLLIVSRDDSQIQQELALLPLNLHITSVSVNEFIQMVQSREESVVSEVMKKNIILIGGEDFYRLLNNAV